MSRKVIPQYTRIICDLCKRDCSTTAFKKQTRVKILRSALDHLGDAVANADVELDLCDNCEQLFSEAINNLTEKP